MMRILFIDNFKLDFDNPMSTLYIHKCKKIASSPLVEKICITDTENVDIALKMKTYEVLLLGQRCPEFYKCNKKFKNIISDNLGKIFKIKFKRSFLLLQDTHPKTYGSLENLTNFINQYRLDLIFTFFENSESRHIRRNCSNSKFFHLPHHIDMNIFRPSSDDDNDSRPYDIILYGDIHPTHYPFRKRLFELLLGLEQRNEGLPKILYVSPPLDPTNNLKVFDADKCENGLAKKIRSAKFAIATKSKYDYLVAKYFEIAACGTIIMGDMATDAQRLPYLNENYIRLDSKMNDSEILAIITEAIKHYDDKEDRVCANRINFTEHILMEYNLDKYLEKLFKILNNIN